MERKKNELGFKLVKDWLGHAPQLMKKFPLLIDSDLKFEPVKEKNFVGNLVIKLDENRSAVIDLLIKNQSSKT